jgi:hypothetical protein
MVAARRFFRSRPVRAIDAGMIIEPWAWKRSARDRVLALRIPPAQPQKEGPPSSVVQGSVGWC